jgi:hypothetical protein
LRGGDRVGGIIGDEDGFTFLFIGSRKNILKIFDTLTNCSVVVVVDNFGLYAGISRGWEVEDCSPTIAKD